MIPLFRSIVTSSPTLGPLVPNVVVVRMAPRAIAASVGSGGGNALTSNFFGGTKQPQPPINRSIATYSHRTTSPMTIMNQARQFPHPLGSVWEANTLLALQKWAISPQPALTGPLLSLDSSRSQSTLVQGGLGLDLARNQQQQQHQFALKGEDLDDVDESEPLDDRDTLSHHTHHKEENVPMDDRDFDSVHTRHEEDPSVPLDDRDFDSHHVVGHRSTSNVGGPEFRDLAGGED